MSSFRVGIRLKLLATLALVAFLPLVILLGITVERWSANREELAGRSVQTVAVIGANSLSVSLVKDIQGLQLDLIDPSILSAFDKPAEELPAATRDECDRLWPTLPLDQEPLAGVLHHPAVKALNKIMKRDGRILQIFITDEYGQTIAATSRTIDFCQADEQWWQDTCNNKKGRIVVPGVEYDPSMRAYTFDVSLPIFTTPNKFVGVARVKMDVSRWVQAAAATVADSPALPVLVRRDGTIIYRQGVQPLSTQMPDWSGAIAQADAVGGWRTSNDEIQGYTPIRFERMIGEFEAVMPDWTLVIYVRRAAVMSAVYRVITWVLTGGILAIGLIFTAGIVIVDRIAVRRLRHLQNATKKIAAGDLSQRVDLGSTWAFLGRDEIDDLSADFNEMIARVQRSHDELIAADKMKTSFIHVASHELRTPISYILGMVKLLKDSKDCDRLIQALQSIGQRAKRLDDIIHAMFKLLPTTLYDREMVYTTIPLSELLEEVYLDCFPFVERRGQRLIITSPPNLSVIRADREKLRDIIENLTMNAIKFTPDKGEVRITVSNELSGYLSIAVQDQGPGIPENELPHIFQPFYTGEDVLTHSTGESGYQKRGIGLGLAIVRHFVELHGGTINISTGPGGSIFNVTIPLEPRAEMLTSFGMGPVQAPRGPRQ